jgi:hypothetical protein
MTDPNVCPTCNEGRLDDKGCASLPKECCAIYFFGECSWAHKQWRNHGSVPGFPLMVIGAEKVHDRRDETIRAGTSFRLGCSGDDDPRPYVTVHRQYGTTLYPIPPWVVCDVDAERGMLHDTWATRDTQEEALAEGWRRLDAMRAKEAT